MPCDAGIQFFQKPAPRRLALILALSMGQLLAIDPRSVAANTSEPAISRLCDRAAITAAQAKEVPLDVLRAISRTETGRTGKSGLQPWPWTVNMEGTGRWFATEDEARAYVFKHFKRGARSFDVGCFQINYKWHGAAFRSIEDMFDPDLNAQYAAEFLNDLYQEFGNWSDAAGAFHSRTPEYARSYAARFEAIRARLSPDTGLARLQTGARRDPPIALVPQPLLHGGSLTMGSLVPITRHAAAGPRPFVILK
ncbi:MAG: hypothetical protein ACI8R4_000474 [Paracoccaceae bacterium]|jgi:hypothetical protein